MILQQILEDLMGGKGFFHQYIFSHYGFYLAEFTPDFKGEKNEVLLCIISSTQQK